MKQIRGNEAGTTTITTTTTTTTTTTLDKNDVRDPRTGEGEGEGEGRLARARKVDPIFLSEGRHQGLITCSGAPYVCGVCRVGRVENGTSENSRQALPPGEKQVRLRRGPRRIPLGQGKASREVETSSRVPVDHCRATSPYSGSQHPPGHSGQSWTLIELS